ncbi:MAG: hypothetical protein AB1611_04845 [bacterium]
MHYLDRLDFVYFLLPALMSFVCVYICNNIKVPSEKRSEKGQ